MDIKERRRELNMSQADLGKKVGLSQQHVQRIENGYDISLDKLSLFAKVLQVNISELLPDTLKDIAQNIENDIPDNFVKIDVIDTIACCGKGFENINENIIGQHMMSLPALRELTTAIPENIKIIKAVGDSMKPTINPDDLVWIDISYKTPASDGLYLILIGRDLMIKRIQINPFDNSIIIKSDNPSYISFNQSDYRQVNVIGKVIYHIQKVG